MSLIRTACVLLLITLSPAFGTSASAQQWQEYRPAGAGYRLEVPGVPELRILQVPTVVGIRPVHRAVVQGGEAWFGVSHFSNPGGPAIPASVVEGVLENMEGEIRESRDLTVDGLPAHRLVLDRQANKQVLVAIAVVSPVSIIQIMYLGPSGTESQPVVMRFFASFAAVPQ